MRPGAAVLYAVAPWLLGLVAGALALGPALGPGFVLRYDMVFVPDPPLGPVQFGAGDGFPRAVPSDAVVGLLSAIAPADAVQSALLLAVFAIGAAGAARLVPPPSGAGALRTLAPRLAAALFFVWNPFVAERLLLGQWAVLLGYAGLPWVCAAAARLTAVRGLPAYITALVPAAVGGFSSVVLSALVSLPVAAAARVRGVLLAVAGLVLVSLPWLVPSLASGARTDPAAVDLFAARADTPFGTAASLFALGGIWNANAVPEAYGDPLPAAARLVLSAAAVAGWFMLLRRGGTGPAGRGLTASAAVGLAIALTGAFQPGRDLLAALIGAWPGFGPLRDGQLYVAPLALLQAVGFGGAVAWLCGGAQEGAAGRAAAVLAVPLPLVLLPGLLWGAGGRLAPVDYPAEWRAVQRTAAADPDPGAVLVLPWSAYRGLDFDGDGAASVVLDPAVKLFDRRVVWNDELRVSVDGHVRTVRGEDPLAREVGAAGRVDAAALGALGVRYVLVEHGTARTDPLHKNTFSPISATADVAFDGPGLTLYRIPDAHVDADEARITGLEVTGWSATVGSIIGSLIASSSHRIPQRPPRPGGTRPRKENPS